MENRQDKQDNKVYKLVLTALMAALCYVSFTYLKIPIPTFGGDYTALHIGNAFCVARSLTARRWLRRSCRLSGYDDCRSD